MLGGQGLEHSSHGHCKGKLHSFVIRVNLAFVKIHLGIIQGRKPLLVRIISPLGFERCIHEKGLQNAAKQEYQDK